MRKPLLEDRLERERLLGRAIRPLADDLRLLDFVHYLTVPGRDSSSEIESLVRSSIEIAFKPDVVSFIAVSNLELSWGRRPTLALQFEFHDSDVHTYFQLILRDQIASIEIDYLHFDDPTQDESANTAIFSAALANAVRDPVQASSPVPPFATATAADNHRTRRGFM